MKKISDEARNTARGANAALPLLYEGIRLERTALPVIKECWGGVADVKDALLSIDSLIRAKNARMDTLSSIVADLDEQEEDNLRESLGGE